MQVQSGDPWELLDYKTKPIKSVLPMTLQFLFITMSTGIAPPAVEVGLTSLNWLLSKREKQFVKSREKTNHYTYMCTYWCWEASGIHNISVMHSLKINTSKPSAINQYNSVKFNNLAWPLNNCSLLLSRCSLYGRLKYYWQCLHVSGTTVTSPKGEERGLDSWLMSLYNLGNDCISESNIIATCNGKSKA